ncbi:MAG TPA: DUF2142 domain-containing protein, partial [Anaerolineae bacterium]|nr:DUF2142 domain-containing protein [Anaerolineae bacterium]
LLLYLALGLVYSVITPVFEASDEWAHYPVVHYVANSLRGDPALGPDRLRWPALGLPVQTPDEPNDWVLEASQPPLYYGLMAVATAWIDTRDLPEVRRPNLHAAAGIPLARGNKNLVLHDPSRERFPWRGTVLAVHLIRFLSLLMGATVVWLTYGIATRTWPRQPIVAALTMALVAFNPMFLFISASVNNDNAVTLLATVALVILLRVLQDGPSERGALVLGLVLGLAALSKLTGLALLPLTALVWTWAAWRHQTGWRTWLRHGLTMVVLVVVLAGWWYVRNLALYGDLLGWSAMQEVVGSREPSTSVFSLLSEFEGFRISFWGLFGAVNVPMDRWVYRVLDVWMLMGSLGLGWLLMLTKPPSLIKKQKSLVNAQVGFDSLSPCHPDSSAMTLLGLWLILVLTGLVRWTLMTHASQGRLIFPAIAAVVTFLAIGWASWTMGPLSEGLLRGRRDGWCALPAVALFLLAAWVPWHTVRPAYELPTILTKADLPPSMVPRYIDFPDALRLLGYELPQRRVRPGEELPVILYWQAPARIEETYHVFVHLLGPDNEQVGGYDTHPGLGLYPTTLWQPGDIVRDEYAVPVDYEMGNQLAPAVLTVDVGLYTWPDFRGPTALDEEGRPTNGRLARVKLVPWKPMTPPSGPPAADFGGQIGLREFAIPSQVKAGAELPIAFTWQALITPTLDYVLFLHLVDTAGNQVAGADSPPQNGRYPTSFWDADELVHDEHQMPVPADLAPGQYDVRVGWYDLATGQRLPLRNEAGQAVGDSLHLASVEVGVW